MSKKELKVFPQLSEITNKEILRQKFNDILGPCLAARQTQIEKCKIERVYYKPGSGCKIYLKIFMQKADGQVDEQIYVGGLFQNENRTIEQIYQRAQQQEYTKPKYGPPLIFIPEWELLLWAFPNDMQLPGVAFLDNPQKIREIAQAHPEQFGLPQGRNGIDDVEGQLVKYVPGMRCAYIYEIWVNGSDGGAEKRAHRLFAKAYRPGHGEEIFNTMKAIWESEAHQRGSLQMPQPYFYDAQNSILWEQAISGRPLAKMIESIPRLPEVSGKIGKMLAAFHSIHLPLKQQMTLESQLEAIRKTAKSIGKTFPEQKSRCDSLHQQLAETALKIRRPPLTPVHCSFKFSHIFQTDEGLTLIDFDGVNLGDPGYDLGRFIAYLHKMQVDGKVDASETQQSIQSFYQAYRQAVPFEVDRGYVDWFTASHLLVSHGYKAVKRLAPESLNSFLELGEQICAGLLQ